jgi:hypothetical protein
MLPREGPESPATAALGGGPRRLTASGYERRRISALDIPAKSQLFLQYRHKPIQTSPEVEKSQDVL